MTNYELGEFERLYSEKTKIQLHYSDGIQPIEIATLPALVQKLASEHEGCVLRIRSIQEDAGGATVTISIDNPGGRDILELKKEL